MADIAPLANLLQDVGDIAILVGFTFKYWVLKLAVMKRIAVLKTLICNIFFKSVYRVKVCWLSYAFGGTVCLKMKL